MATDKDYFEPQMNDLRSKYTIFKDYSDYHLFTVMCLKYFFFNDDNSPFDPERVNDYITDGAKDGGLDAIFNDCRSEGNDLIIAQSKYYKKKKLTPSDIRTEWRKISDTLTNLKNDRLKDLSSYTVTAFKNAENDMENNGQRKIYFFTTYQANKRVAESLRTQMAESFPGYTTEIKFYNDIADRIDLCDSVEQFVDNDFLILDEKENYLKYKDSIVVNISAKSLRELHSKHRNSLLGMNLRYYVRQKSVDQGIKETIENEPQNFWYKNNGIIIICDDYTIKDTHLYLKNFSIINGGQTTSIIGNPSIDILEDFYIQCKIIKPTMLSSDDEKNQFIHNIAKATNTQKPIKDSDLRANSPEQLDLKERLKKRHVYYVTKKGENAPKVYAKKQLLNLLKFGKLSFASVLQMPGSSRSDSAKMYNREYYNTIFGKEAPEGIIADILKIDNYYEAFKKNITKIIPEIRPTELEVIKNGKTFQLACITFLCKLNYNVFSMRDITTAINDIDKLKNIIQQTGQMSVIMNKQINNEREIFYTIFRQISLFTLKISYSMATEVAKRLQQSISASNYFKSDKNYYTDVIPALCNNYEENSTLKNAIQKICGLKS